MIGEAGKTMRRIFIPLAAFLSGSALITGVYLGFLAALQGWNYAVLQLARDRLYVVPIIAAFGIQAALYSILRLGLYGPATGTRPGGAVIGASGSTSATAMVACCLHQATNVLPILGLSAATAFLARYQRPFMLVGLAMNIGGIVFMLLVLYRARQRVYPALEVA